MIHQGDTVVVAHLEWERDKPRRAYGEEVASTIFGEIRVRRETLFGLKTWQWECANDDYPDGGHGFRTMADAKAAGAKWYISRLEPAVVPVFSEAAS